MLRYQLIESLPRIILYLYFCSLIDLAGLIRKAYREVFDRFVYDLVTLAVIIDPIGMAAIFAALSQSTPPGGRRAMAVRGTAIAAGICVAFAFGGEALLRAMGVSLAAFQAAGGALLFLLATDRCSHTNPGCGSRPEPRPTRRNAASIYPSSPSQSP